MRDGRGRERPILSCARCAVGLTPGQGDHYVVKIIAVGDPAPPIISEEDLARDAGREIRRLIDQLKGASEQDLADQVYRLKLLYLCGPCYRRWIEDPVHASSS